jgi:hypothetical protein
VRREKVAEYNISLAEARELYSDDSLVGQWWQYVEERFNGGADFTRQAARTLTDGELRSLGRTKRGLQDGLPRHYIKVARRVA